ncbi:hypothetical protein KY338_03365 [Candidatus Woesearchaeota archaeon]|nr:hypothetical protein [Candidatus Woesearchaeota archaeon]MBW3005358.1 hypothetical protein [Candidatus Woesearchaeota archaeon]
MNYVLQDRKLYEVKGRKKLPFAQITDEECGASNIVLKLDVDGRPELTKDFQEKVLGFAYETEEGTTFHFRYNGDPHALHFDKSGKAYDLHLCFIPDFDVQQFLTDIEKNPSFHRKVGPQFPPYKFDPNDLAGSVKRLAEAEKTFIKNLNSLKTKNPVLFAEAYKFLVANDYIPPSPMLQKINLTDEQSGYFSRFALEAGDSSIASKVAKNLIQFAKDKNKPIEQMRFGSMAEQTTYYLLCTLIADIHDTIVLEPEAPQHSALEERLLFARKIQTRLKQLKQEKLNSSD